MRTDAYWSDGAQVVAQDYVHGILWAQKYGSPYRIIDPEKISATAIDDFTLQVDFDGTPISGDNFEFTEEFLRWVSTVSMPAAWPYREDYDYGEIALLPTNGPYMLDKKGIKEKRDGTLTVRLEKNPAYHDANELQINEIEILFNPDSNEVFSEFKKGNLDVMIGDCLTPIDELGGVTLCGDAEELWLYDDPAFIPLHSIAVDLFSQSRCFSHR